MGNAVKGQYTFEAAGRRWTMEFSPNAFCELEDATGETTMGFLGRLQQSPDKLAIREARQLFWAGLIEHQPEVSLRDAGGVMRSLGGMGPAMDLLMQAVSGAFPDEDGAGDASGNVAAAPS